MMMRLLKCKWLRFFAAYVAIFLFLLLYDERLNPEIDQFIDLSGDSAPTLENGYYFAVGFDAPVGSNPHTTGIRTVNAFELALKKEPLLEEFDRKATYKAAPVSFAGTIPSFYTKKGVSCLEFGKKSAKDIEKLLVDNQELINRYHILSRYPHFKETASSNLAFFGATFLPIVQTHRLLLANIAVEVHMGRSAEALTKLANDTRLWRHLLAEGHDRTTKIFATSILKENYRLLSEIIATRMPVGEQRAMVDSMLTPLERSELDLSRTKRREFQIQMLLIRKMRTVALTGKTTQKKERHYLADILIGLATKPNASANLLFPRFRHAVALSALSPAQILNETEKWKGKNKTRLGWDFLYNPFGNVMYVFPGDLLNFEPFFHDNRVHDLDGLIRLVGLQLLVKQKRIQPAGMKEFLAQSDSRHVNPYTDKPMKWDARKQCIYFESYWSFKADSKDRIELCLRGSRG